MTIDMIDPNMKNVMDYVSSRIKKQHLRGIDLFRAAETQGLVEGRSDELSQIRQKVQKKLHSKEVEHKRVLTKIKSDKQVGRQ